MIDGVQIRIRDILYVLKKRWKTVLLCTCVGLILGIGLIGITVIRNGGRNYTISTSFAISTKSSSGYLMGSANASKDDYYLTQDMTDAVSYIMKSDAVMEAAVENSRINGLTPADITPYLNLARYGNTQIIELKLNWKNSDQGIELVKAILDATNTILPETLQLGGLSIINEPVSVYEGEFAVSSYSGLVLGILGFLAGVLFLILDLLMRPKLLNLNDVEEQLDLDILGVVPQKDQAFSERRSLLTEGVVPGEMMQNYASSTYILDHLFGLNEKHKCFYVTSTNDGEGKSLAAANLAICCAERGKKVLLVDLDTRNPGLGNLFLEQMDYRHSVNALQQGNGEDVIVRLNDHLDLLPLILENHLLTINDTVLSYIEKAKSRYDYIILDASPIGERSDVLALNQIAGACLFVIRYDYALLSNIRRAIEKLDKSGVRVLGALINGYSALDARSKAFVPSVSQPVRKEKKDLMEAAEEEVGTDDSVRSVLQDLDKTGNVIHAESNDGELEHILGTGNEKK